MDGCKILQDEIPFWDGLFSGAMLVLRRVPRNINMKWISESWTGGVEGRFGIFQGYVGVFLDKTLTNVSMIYAVPDL